MYLYGVEIKNFRSIGDEPLSLSPLGKVNILIGENNSGKSNLIKIFKIISDWVQSKEINLSELDFHNRSQNNSVEFTLFFKIEDSDEFSGLLEFDSNGIVWFKFSLINQQFIIIDDSFRRISEFIYGLNTYKILFKPKNAVPINNLQTLQKTFSQKSTELFQRFSSCMKRVILIPEFRQIRKGEKYLHDGTNLIEVLNGFKNPIIGKDKDEEKFIRIQHFARDLLNLPDANLQISYPDSKIIIENLGLRLPLENYGTGVHELIILVTAILMQENYLYCIEEPEIHFHPRLQKQLIRFFEKDTNSQFLISTHSSALINQVLNSEAGEVFFLEKIKGNTTCRNVLSRFEAKDIFNSLGVNPGDILLANCIIWVEGPSDRILINRWIELLGGDVKEGIDYICFFYRRYSSLGIGEDVDFENQINAIQINPNVIWLTDSDKTDDNEIVCIEKEKMKNSCNEIGGLGLITDGREIENYFSKSIIDKFLLEVRGVSAEKPLGKYQKFGIFLDETTRQNGLDSINYDNQKVNYCRKITELYSVDDMSEELKEFTQKIIDKIKTFKE